MLKKILAGYAVVFTAVLRFAILMAVCAGTGILIVWPLWLLADANPSLYTLVFSVLAGSVVVFFTAIKIRAAVRRDPRRFFRSLARKMTLAAGLCACIALVLAWQRLFAGAVLILTLAVYGYLAFVLAPDSRHNPQ